MLLNTLDYQLIGDMSEEYSNGEKFTHGVYRCKTAKKYPYNLNLILKMYSIETVLLPLQQDERLTQALSHAGFDNIPTNCILDKTIPGIGATYGEIHAKRHSIIIEPNVPVIKGKVKEHQDLDMLGIHEGVTVLHVQKYLSRESTGYKKLITTPEGFWKIREAANKLELNIYSKFFCLFDECEKLNQDVGYRPNITNPIEDFFLFDQKAFVSATPLAIQHPMVKEQNFFKLKIKPEFAYQKAIELVITNDIARVLTERMEALKNSPCVCVFYKSIAGIDSIIYTMQKNHSSRIFCSPKYRPTLLKKGFINVESDFSLPLATYNFFTSRYFSAFDIKTSLKPDIIILTDLRQAQFSLIDPFTEAIQIQGRFREGLMDGINYNSLVHITNYDYSGNLHPKTNEQLDKEIEQYRNNHHYFQVQHTEATDHVVKDALAKDLAKLTYSKLLNKNLSLNEFAVNNIYNEERVKSYYDSHDTLVNAYKSTGFFNVTTSEKPDLRFFLYEYRLSTKKNESKKSKIKRLVELLKTLKWDTDNITFRSTIIEAFDEAHIIVDAYLKLGEEFIVSVDYNLTKITKTLDRHESDNKRFCPEILFEISSLFELNISQDKKIYQQKLKEVYGRYNILQKVTQDTIRDYFHLKDNKGVNPPVFKLTSFKFILTNP